MPLRSNLASVCPRCPPALTLIGATYIMPSVRPHIATCPRSRGDGVQGLQRDHLVVQVQDTDVVCKPQRQEQPWLTPKRYSRRYSRPDICKNDEPGSFALVHYYRLLECGQHLWVNPVSYRTWPLRNARRLTRKSRKTIYFYRLALPTSRQKQTRFNAAVANRY